MKKISLLFLLFIGATAAFGQAMGNYSNRAAGNDDSEVSGNYNDVNTRKPGVVNPSLEPTFPYGTNIMEFKATALYNAKADAFTAIFNVVQLGETAQESDDRMNGRLSSFINALVQAGVKREDIFVDMITFLPIYEYKEGEKRLFSPKTFSEVPAGFELQKNVHIKFTESSTLDRVVSIAAQNEIYDLVKVEYFVNDNEKIYNTLRERTIAYLSKKTEDFKKLGIRLDTIYHVIAEAQTATYPAERYQRYTAYSSQSLDAAKKRTSQITQVRKPTTMFYNKLPYNQYDIIINPTVSEPAVQFSYSLKIHYTVKEPAPKEIKKFMLISPQGDLKMIDVR